MLNMYPYAFIFVIFIHSSGMLFGKALPSAQARQLLYDAVKLGNIGKVRKLVANDIDLMMDIGVGRTAFECAVKVKEMSIAAVLLREMKGVNGLDDMGWTPLNFAVVGSDDSLMGELIRLGSKPEIGRQDAYEMADIMGNRAVLENLVSSNSLLRSKNDAINKLKIDVVMFPVHLAAAEGDLERVKTLEGEGHDINAIAVSHSRESWKHSVNKIRPIHLATMFGHAEVVKYLLARGVKVGTPTGGRGFAAWGEGRAYRKGAYSSVPVVKTAMEFAVLFQQTEAMQVLHDAGAELSSKAMLLAIRQRRVQAVKFMLEAGAGVDNGAGDANDTHLELILHEIELIADSIDYFGLRGKMSIAFREGVAIAELLMRHGATARNRRVDTVSRSLKSLRKRAMSSRKTAVRFRTTTDGEDTLLTSVDQLSLLVAVFLGMRM